MKNYSKILWGVVIIAIGIVLALNALDITDIDIFFDGWWTLFIIIPCLVGIFKNPRKSSNYICLAIGVYLLLCCLDIISFGFFWKLLIPAIVVIIGIKLISGGVGSGKSSSIFKSARNSGRSPRTVFAAFSSNNDSYSGNDFECAELTAVFGAVKYDLSNAIITKDCAISVCSVFGGIDVIVPNNVNVKINSLSLFGGVDNKTPRINGAPTIYVSGLCLFGGVDIK